MDHAEGSSFLRGTASAGGWGGFDRAHLTLAPAIACMSVALHLHQERLHVLEMAGRCGCRHRCSATAHGRHRPRFEGVRAASRSRWSCCRNDPASHPPGMAIGRSNRIDAIGAISMQSTCAIDHHTDRPLETQPDGKRTSETSSDIGRTGRRSAGRLHERKGRPVARPPFRNTDSEEPVITWLRLHPHPDRT